MIARTARYVTRVYTYRYGGAQQPDGPAPSFLVASKVPIFREVKRYRKRTRSIFRGDLERRLYGAAVASADAIRAAQVALLSSSARLAAMLVPSVSAPIRASRNGVIAGPVTCASAASCSAWASAAAKSLSGSASASGIGQVTSSPPPRPLSHCARAIAAISAGVSARNGTRSPLVRQ